MAHAGDREQVLSFNLLDESPVPAKLSSENSRAPSLTITQKLRWLRSNLPVIVQPVCDIRNGYPLIGVFVCFEEIEDSSRKVFKAHLKIIYEGEATYDRRPAWKEVPNHFGSFLYRSFNYWVWRRTVDIDQLCFEDVSFSEEKDENESRHSWASISTEDYNGEQVWNRGVKGDFCCFFSLNYHYDLNAPYDQWDKLEGGSRPILNLNTNNHLHGPEDRNPEMEKYRWVTYPVWEGNSEDAELYGRAVAAHKCTLVSCFRATWCCCFQRLQPDKVDPGYFFELPVFELDAGT